MIEKYKQAAAESFAANKWRFEKAEILKHAVLADVPAVLQAEIVDFLDFAAENPPVSAYLWQYYYALYESGEAWFPIARVGQILLQSLAEERFPGLFSTVVSLAAAVHFAEFLQKNGLTSPEYLDSYYKNVRRFMDMNYVRDNTYALLRHGYFLYGYAKPYTLRIGRLAYQMDSYSNDVAELYAQGDKYIFAALPTAQFGADGYTAEDGDFVPTLTYENSCLYANTFDEQGKIVRTVQSFVNAVPLLQNGTPVIRIHIPGEGKLTAEAVEASFAAAMPVLHRVFGHMHPQQVVCNSWLLDGQLQSILPPTSNILHFAGYFEHITGAPDKNALYEHVFRTPICPPAQLVPQNKFQAAILQLYNEGKELRYGYGILKKEWQQI